MGQNSKEMKEYLERIDNNKGNWFTDGGCINNGESNAIASWVVYQNELKIEIGGLVSDKDNVNNVIAEIEAIKRCVFKIIEL